jgi:hypothetical protein
VYWGGQEYIGLAGTEFVVDVEVDMMGVVVEGGNVFPPVPEIGVETMVVPDIAGCGGLAQLLPIDANPEVRYAMLDGTLSLPLAA